MLRLILAVGAAFLAITILGLATQIALLKIFFHGGLGPFDTEGMPPAYLLANGVSTLLYAVIGGCISASIGKKYEAPTILGALMLGMAIGGVVMNRGSQPIWYAISVPLVAAVVATISGYAWLGRRPEAERKPSRR